MKDLIVEEVRKIRHEIEQEYNQSMEKYLEHIYTEQKKHGNNLVRRRPKPLRKRKAINHKICSIFYSFFCFDFNSITPQ